MSIKFYSPRNQFGEFSNFYVAPLKINGITYRTSEHYFQAQKYTHNKTHFNDIVNAKTPSIAAKLGRMKTIPIREDWEQIKNGVMLEVLRYKFTQHENLKKLLLDTKNKILIEHTSNDNYWGDGGDGTGLNMLGKCLMEIRLELKN